MSCAAMGSCSRDEYRLPRSRRRSFAIFSVDTTTRLRPNMLSRKMGPYSSAQSLNFNHECLGGMSKRLPMAGLPT